MQNFRILIIDDDPNICQLLSLYLNKYNFENKSIHNGLHIKEQLTEYDPDLILLDLMLPELNGYEICEIIRKKSNVPIIMISAKGESSDKILGLDIGADDYIQKPFDSEEVISRIKSVLRRNGLTNSNNAITSMDMSITYPGLHVNVEEHLVVYKDQRIELPPKELQLLHYLLRHPNQVITRNSLLEKIWGYEYIGDSRTVDVHIKRIREKIADHENWKIATVWGTGYRFEVGKDSI